MRCYVKVSGKGRRIGIAEDYGTGAFDAAYEVAVVALGGVLRCAVKVDVKLNSAATLRRRQPIRPSGLLRVTPEQASQGQDQGRVGHAPSGMDKIVAFDQRQSLDDWSRKRTRQARTAGTEW